MRTDFSQQFDVAELRKPLVVVHHDGIVRTIAEAQQALDLASDAGGWVTGQIITVSGGQ